MARPTVETRNIKQGIGGTMIIAWWDKEHPHLIDLIEDSILPWINANWLEKRPATKEELEMYKKGIRTYRIKKGEV